MADGRFGLDNRVRKLDMNQTTQDEKRLPETIRALLVLFVVGIAADGILTAGDRWPAWAGGALVLLMTVSFWGLVTLTRISDHPAAKTPEDPAKTLGTRVRELMARPLRSWTTRRRRRRTAPSTQGAA